MRITRFVFALATFVFIVFASPHSLPILAAESPKCDPAPLLKKANELKSTGDTKKDAAMLAKLGDEFHSMNAICNGFRFEGKTNKAIGVVAIPSGTWLVTLTTKGYFILKSKVISGTCDVDGSSVDGVSIFAASQGDAADSISVVLDSKDCKFLLTSDLVSTAYVLTFDPVG